MMVGLVDYRGLQETTTDGYVGLLALARQLVGERLLFARRTYPDELTLHFGEAVRIPGPQGRVLTRGSYVLGTAASEWTFKMAKQGATAFVGELLAAGPYASQHEWSRPVSEDKLDELLANMSGQIVVGVDMAAHPNGFALSLYLSDGSTLSILPSPDSSATSANGEEHALVPDWELFTPFNRFLRVGPGRSWAYLPSDQPESASSQSA